MREEELLNLRLDLIQAKQAKENLNLVKQGYEFVTKNKTYVAIEDLEREKHYDKVYRIWDVENKCWLRTSKGHSYWAGKSTAKGIATYYQNHTYRDEVQDIKYIVNEFNLVPEE